MRLINILVIAVLILSASFVYKIKFDSTLQAERIGKIRNELRRERDASDPDVIAGRRFHAMNQWPENLPGFREQTLKYMTTLETLCKKLVTLYALALDLPADYFAESFKTPHMILRQSRYPQIDARDETVASLVPHTDSGFMTLLPPNKVEGLSILLPNGQWLDAPSVEGAFVVNGGDILHHGG